MTPIALTIGFYVDSVPFTREVIAGATSLGGSESACLGLARALRARGHRVSIYASKIAADAPPVDAWGVKWYPAAILEDETLALEWDVFVSLRMPGAFNRPRNARFRVLWNQDLLNTEAYKSLVMAHAWAYDAVVYVSGYHRRQWEELLPELTPLGHVTKNGFDPAHVPTGVTKNPSQIIYISRPERGLTPLLAMWPALKAKVPEATLALCRYSSMYDQGPGSWSDVCARYDREVEAVNAKVGGIRFLGELGKAELYREIATSAVMWYPGVVDFAETSCIAAVEAQACGTPFVGSYKGALPETVPNGVLIPGDAMSPAYQEASVAAVARLLQDCRGQSFRYRSRVKAGREHVEPYRYDRLAAEWEAWLLGVFHERYASNKLGVLRQLLHYDDHTAAKIVADEIVASVEDPYDDNDTVLLEAIEAQAFCDRVIAGEDQGAEDYADRASPNPIREAGLERFQVAATAFEGCTHVLDLACGPGSMAFALTKLYPEIRVTGIDYAARNIEAARTAAEEAGVADRCTFLAGAVYDFATQQPCDVRALLPEGVTYDGVFVGEFLEHCGNYKDLIDAIDRLVTPGSPVVFTVPYGPLMEVMPRTVPLKRGHVHHFSQRDLNAVLGQKQDLEIRFLHWPGVTYRGSKTGNWLIGYKASDAPTGERPYRERILTARPYQRLSVGIIAGEAEFEIGKCLEHVWPIADEIVIGLCGTTDGTRAVAEAFDAPSHQHKVRFVELPTVNDHPDGFAGVRNAVLEACTGEWFLWIDTDELLMRGTYVAQYLESGPYLGYSIHQNHLQVDAPNHYDKPIRLFRRRPDIRFYGCVHEQPQLGDANGDIHPGLEVHDVQIAHVGYLIADVRRRKMLNRNLPLLERDRDRFPERRLGALLVLRDLVNLGDIACESTAGQVNTVAVEYYRRAFDLWLQEFDDPADKYHEIGRPFYERALQQLGLGLEVETSLAGKPGGLNGSRAKPHRYWVRDAAELERLIGFRVKRAADQIRQPPLHVDPFEDGADGATVRAVEDSAPVA